MESLKFTARDVLAIGSLIVTVVGLYFSVRAEITKLGADYTADKRVLEIKIQALEQKVEHLETTNARSEYENIDTNGNQKQSKRRR